MQIQPDRQRYAELCRKSSRVPVCLEMPMQTFDPVRLHRALFGDSADSFIFDSGKGPDATARYTILGISNSRGVHIQDGVTTVILPDGTDRIAGGPASGWNLLDFDVSVAAVDYLPHFWGGWVGYIGYEVAEWFETLPPRKRDDLKLPDLRFMQVDALFVYDHSERVLKMIASDVNDGTDADYDARVREVQGMAQRVHRAFAQHNGHNSVPKNAAQPVGTTGNGLRANMSREEYMQRVEKAKAYIRDGDIYQANIAQRFELDTRDGPMELFSRLRRVNPSPFSGYLKFKDWAIVSCSPERLVKVAGSKIETRPIAGTRPRGGDAEKDAHLSRELMLNEKERAEHLMLVDLERNDLGRLCVEGGVRVTDLMFLEQYSHVHHIVSNIEGDLRSGVTVRDILRAVFPGGTITGCPKVRCMEIINELEPDARGPYSGSFGYIGFAPHLDLNILIRTILLKSGKAYFHAGAGIVADSHPEREYQETLDKAAALIEVLSAGRGTP